MDVENIIRDTLQEFLNERDEITSESGNNAIVQAQEDAAVKVGLKILSMTFGALDATVNDHLFALIEARVKECIPGDE